MTKSSTIFLLLAILIVLSVDGLSQAPDDNDFQSWNDLQVTVGLTKKVDLYTTTTVQFGSDLTNANNTRFSIGVTYKPIKRLSVTPLITFISVRDSHNVFRYEYRYALRGVYKYQFEHFAISHRSQFEYRYRPGTNRWRYRPSITIEKPLPKSFVPGLKVFVTDEPFFDSASGRFSRNRISAGINKSINKKLSLDVYFLHQGDNFSHPASVNVIGTALKLAL